MSTNNDSWFDFDLNVSFDVTGGTAFKTVEESLQYHNSLLDFGRLNDPVRSHEIPRNLVECVVLHNALLAYAYTELMNREWENVEALSDYLGSLLAKLKEFELKHVRSCYDELETSDRKDIGWFYEQYQRAGSKMFRLPQVANMTSRLYTVFPLLESFIECQMHAEELKKIVDRDGATLESIRETALPILSNIHVDTMRAVYAKTLKLEKAISEQSDS